MPNALIFIPAPSVATGITLVGSSVQTTPPEWVSGVGNAGGNTIVIPDASGTANGDLSFAILSSQTVNNVTVVPTGWTEYTPSSDNLRLFERTVNNDISSSHTWTYQTAGVTRAGVLAAVRGGVVAQRLTATNTNVIPDFTSPGAGSMLIVAASTGNTQELLGVGNLTRRERTVTRGSAGYQASLQTALFIEENLPAGLISGRQIDLNGGASSGLRLQVIAIGAN